MIDPCCYEIAYPHFHSHLQSTPANLDMITSHQDSDGRRREPVDLTIWTRRFVHSNNNRAHNSNQTVFFFTYTMRLKQQYLN